LSIYVIVFHDCFFL